MDDMQALHDATAKSPNIRHLEVAAGALAQAPRLIREVFGAQRVILFADEKSWAAAGAKLEAILAAQGFTITKHIEKAKPKPKPSVELSKIFAELIVRNDGLAVAIGSGVMNDVVKHAAFTLSRPYLCVATAVSMDGYTSAGAPLSEKGFKKTIQCKPPAAIIADLDVLAAAPKAMTSWGYADLAGKIPAGADWILADGLGVEAMDVVSFDMVQAPLRRWLSQPEKIASGDLAAMEGLFAGLAMVGFAMERHGSSRPASGADHQIAHLWEMEDHQYQGEAVSHGACVAVGSLASLGLHHYFLKQNVMALDVEKIIAQAPNFDAKVADIYQQLGEGEIAKRAIEETRLKHLSPDAHRARLTRLQDNFASLRDRLLAHLPSLSAFREDLAKAGAPKSAQEIGIDAQKLRQTMYNARFIRSRYTILDVLEEINLLGPAIDAVVADIA